MIKELIKVARKLESVGLNKEARLIKSAIFKYSSKYEVETSVAGTIWLALRSAYGGEGDPSVIHYFARKVDAEAWLTAQQGDERNSPPYIEEVEVEVVKNLNKTAMDFGQG
jgi:hypothetical protein